MYDPAEKYFNCTDIQRAFFEAGIKLGAIFHQYTGIPVNSENASMAEEFIERSTMIQPFVENVRISINNVKRSSGTYSYSSLNEKMLHAEVLINYNGKKVLGVLNYDEGLDYPVMYAKEVL
ncbi:dihydroneopterin aldolase family protein [Picrophilus oshimae]|uniref:Dihydroneopterin aldolase n=2 Tax=Picrophilus torridus (strain ATCC 700027 / DSM 9790 / JCM 10055 / NBRC 100828 / KAW 2/3) TaxID=1122961 RepID=MPTD_PICTO|nr:dihydroneopterin aldolase family protein [Picrophilus oshimae]Q6L2J9.1 RecName: Full=Dihydroneopterin aldolase; Short=DHNA; AltName: Full=7,8-dihydroneopterin aldolase [Picrophilus oshimae DSM 9789]AAT42803.1 hypothetical protein PTO0218 [Picrophilus oshimae DSM 9789]SMD31564.1 hypothetical protein SAMN02745355_1515 [Picrophilus oshimae DSM 9789]